MIVFQDIMRMLRNDDEEQFTCSALLLVLPVVFSGGAEVTLLMERPLDSPKVGVGVVVVNPLDSIREGLVLLIDNPLLSPCTLPCTLLSSWLNFTLTKFAISMMDYFEV